MKSSSSGIPVYIRGEERGIGFYESLNFFKQNGSEFWIGADGKEIGKEEVVGGSEDCEEENGDVNGATAAWMPF